MRSSHDDPAELGGRLGRAATEVDLEALAHGLRAAISGEVRFDNGSRHLYATDASNFRQVPIGVVVPRTVDELVAVHEVCREFGAPITNRGGGTSLAGQACNVAVVVDTSKYLRRIVDVDPERRRAITEPGVILDELRERTEGEHGLTWGPDPSTHNRCTIGGSVGNNACGVHAYAYGRADENVEALEVLTYDGERMWVGATSGDELEGIIAGGGRRAQTYRDLRDLRDRYADLIRRRFPDIPRRVSGYNLTELLPENGFQVARALVGTEGTCVTYLHVEAKLNPRHEHVVLAVAAYPDIYAAADHVPLINAWGRGTKASALEALDGHLLQSIKAKHLRPGALPHLPAGEAWLLVELHGETAAAAERRADELRELLLDQRVVPDVAVYTDPAQQQVVWGARKAGLGVTARIGGVDHWPGWEDSAVAPDDVPSYLRELGALFQRHGYDVAVYGHLGDGCIHCRIPFDLASAPGIDRYRAFLDDAADLCHAYGGSFSGEHGDGQQRGALLEKMFGPELVQAFREFKAIWDPDGGMNPGKLVDADAVDANLKLGADHRPREPEVRFAYAEDGGSFARAALRCVGLGKCRRADGAGTMCPSYFVTQEEMHSTRGRARLLYEMLRPDAELAGWRDEHVKEALELCLSCKGCTVDCPVGVDMPTYKAEFFHHHYAGRPHPRVHYALGGIDVWSRLAQRMPATANRALQAPGLGRLLKRAAGVAADRPAPRYARETFRDWWRRREPRNLDRPPVLLFPDTFTNHFWPAVGRATVAVLENAGFRVTIPDGPLCCGRPLYDFGFLDRADRYLGRLLERLGPGADGGVPIVGMEPSCVAVLRDELVKLRPDDTRAKQVASSTHTLAELLLDADFDFPQLERRAVVHGHCHQKGTIGMEADFRAFDRMGLDFTELDASCCGLAGSFGFEAGEKYEVSVAMGETRLLPAVRAADPTTLVVADGFSCRTQIDHLQRLNGAGPAGHRHALHLAQLIRMAHEHGPDGVPRHLLPEAPYVDDPGTRTR